MSRGGPGEPAIRFDLKGAPSIHATHLGVPAGDVVEGTLGRPAPGEDNPPKARAFDVGMRADNLRQRDPNSLIVRRGDFQPSTPMVKKVPIARNALRWPLASQRAVGLARPRRGEGVRRNVAEWKGSVIRTKAVPIDWPECLSTIWKSRSTSCCSCSQGCGVTAIAMATHRKPNETRQVIVRNRPRGSVAAQCLASRPPIHERNKAGPVMKTPKNKQPRATGGKHPQIAKRRDGQPFAAYSMRGLTLSR